MLKNDFNYVLVVAQFTNPSDIDLSKFFGEFNFWQLMLNLRQKHLLF